ncbi:sensor histidine kinase [Maribacter polysiphoniae]|uniref:Histidine kinase n=1 Tax=Maribacter polysiphoniae TaxID=429344 RepID=A0A316ENP6_9FLAO|nr:sensor histidine kinase [Maribacter polysiphoniae]MBD1259046.1 sensor histidine kinase [Maribacter polysiphoniae]PWK24600.1 histidine kinase [Maribacter polysiphoniae]
MILQKKNIPQVLVHVFIWCALFALILYPYLALSRTIPNSTLIKIPTAILLFYFNYFLLVPRLLLNSRKMLYIAVSILLLGLITYVMHALFPPFEPKDFTNPMRHMTPPRKDLLAFRFPMMPLISFGVPFLFSTMLRVYMGWQKNENLRKSIEKEKVQSELQFLKAQLNPHFLFNSLNTIYSLSVKKSNDTSEAIINLSELMRYMLYEADKNHVPLCKEIEYIKSYVALQRLRLANSENVHLKISGDDNNKNIPPLLFISFIENAFKYGTDYNGKTMVKINFLIQESSIHFNVVNSIGNLKAKAKSSGLGLENVKNRLKYLYPNSHELRINDDGKTYEVDLTINL